MGHDNTDQFIDKLSSELKPIRKLLPLKWRIPLFINRIAPDKYHLYLRQEGHWGLETILYAIPRDVTI